MIADKHAPPASSQHKSCAEAGGSSADDDDIIIRLHEIRLKLLFREKLSGKISSRSNREVCRTEASESAVHRHRRMNPAQHPSKYGSTIDSPMPGGEEAGRIARTLRPSSTLPFVREGDSPCSDNYSSPSGLLLADF
jgi:hypothetical protein